MAARHGGQFDGPREDRLTARVICPARMDTKPRFTANDRPSRDIPDACVLFEIAIDEAERGEAKADGGAPILGYAPAGRP